MITVKLSVDHQQNLVEDTAQNVIDWSFSALLQLMPTTSTTEIYMLYINYWITQSDNIDILFTEIYILCTDYWATQSDDIDTLFTEIYISCINYWAIQSDDIDTSFTEIYILYTNYWVTQFSDLDTETHIFNTEILTTTASQLQLNIINIQDNSSVHSHKHNNESLQSHHTLSFYSEAYNI